VNKVKKNKTTGRDEGRKERKVREKQIKPQGDLLKEEVIKLITFYALPKD
jgi:hypothetical protein